MPIIMHVQFYLYYKHSMHERKTNVNITTDLHWVHVHIVTSPAHAAKLLLALSRCSCIACRRYSFERHADKSCVPVHASYVQFELPHTSEYYTWSHGMLLVTTVFTTLQPRSINGFSVSSCMNPYMQVIVLSFSQSRSLYMHVYNYTCTSN